MLPPPVFAHVSASAVQRRGVLFCLRLLGHRVWGLRGQQVITLIMFGGLHIVLAVAMLAVHFTVATTGCGAVHAYQLALHAE